MPGARSSVMRWDVRAFDLFAPVYDRFMPATDGVALRKALAVADRRVDRILEVGGGSGRVAGEIGATVVDPARGMLRRARRRGLETVQASATDLPHPDGSVDAVVVVDAFHHFPAGRRCLSEMARVLAPGGVLVITDFDRGTRLAPTADRSGVHPGQAGVGHLARADVPPPVGGRQVGQGRVGRVVGEGGAVGRIGHGAGYRAGVHPPGGAVE